MDLPTVYKPCTHPKHCRKNPSRVPYEHEASYLSLCIAFLQGELHLESTIRRVGAFSFLAFFFGVLVRHYLLWM